MEKKKFETIELNGEKVYLKKSKSGWKTINPIKNEDGTINYKNLLIGGSYFNLIKVIFLVLLILFVAFSYKADMNKCRDFWNDIDTITLLNYEKNGTINDLYNNMNLSSIYGSLNNLENKINDIPIK